ncbi:MAG: sugar:sodium symporter [Lachnospiraceae bacterium]|nr:sugar:sodium symporter [Lachnospiraceae bacterium]
MKLGMTQKISYGLGAVGKDMVYMLSASYVLYYYQDLLGVSAIVMGTILMVARIFDALNDPLMGVIVAKTKTKWGKFRPWLMIGTITNAVILFLMFSAPPTLDAKGMAAYAATFYILWGITYTMMDIPYWSMIPFLTTGKDREALTTMARAFAGIGSALITVVTMMVVPLLGGGNEVEGFKWFALIVAILFIAAITLTCVKIKEKSTEKMKTTSVREMFKALIGNDQAVTVVIAIVLINTSLYITSNLLIYFFKYDIGGVGWNKAYVLFNTFGGAIQVLSMMLFYPLIRQLLTNIKVFYLSFIMAIVGYGTLFVFMIIGLSNVYVLMIPGFFIFCAFGFLTILTTVFLANTVDYSEYKNNRRDESVIFSMQTFVVKLASGFAAFAASICLQIANISSDTSEAAAAATTTGNVMVLRFTMSVLPIVGMLIAVAVFGKRFILTDAKMSEINAELESRRAAQPSEEEE